MLEHRVIPCLLLSNGGLYKTCKFSDPKYIGDPVNAIRIFNDKEVDELIVLDISKKNSHWEPDYLLIEQFAGESFMPLAYGGGVKTIEQARKLFSLGIEKVCVQTGALEDISFVKRLADEFGSQSILISIDIKKNWTGKYKLYSSATGKTLSKKWQDFLSEALDAGAGEVVMNSVDRDGMMQGMDLDLIKQANSLVSIPLIAAGGAGSLDHIKEAIDAGADAIAAGSLFVFYGKFRAVLINYPKREEIERKLNGRR